MTPTWAATLDRLARGGALLRRARAHRLPRLQPVRLHRRRSASCSPGSRTTSRSRRCSALTERETPAGRRTALRARRLRAALPHLAERAPSRPSRVAVLPWRRRAPRLRAGSQATCSSTTSASCATSGASRGGGPAPVPGQRDPQGTPARRHGGARRPARSRSAASRRRSRASASAPPRAGKPPDRDVRTIETLVPPEQDAKKVAALREIRALALAGAAAASTPRAGGARAVDPAGDIPPVTLDDVPASLRRAVHREGRPRRPRALRRAGPPA